MKEPSAIFCQNHILQNKRLLSVCISYLEFSVFKSQSNKIFTTITIPTHAQKLILIEQYANNFLPLLLKHKINLFMCVENCSSSLFSFVILYSLIDFDYSTKNKRKVFGSLTTSGNIFRVRS